MAVLRPLSQTAMRHLHRECVNTTPITHPPQLQQQYRQKHSTWVSNLIFCVNFFWSSFYSFQITIPLRQFAIDNITRYNLIPPPKVSRLAFACISIVAMCDIIVRATRLPATSIRLPDTSGSGEQLCRGACCDAMPVQLVPLASLLPYFSIFQRFFL